MPLIPLLAVVIGIVVFIISIPFLLILRYRAGIARRLARPWVATVNLLSFLISAVIFIWLAAMTNFWVPRAFGYSLLGMLFGCLLGLLGLALTRWEKTAGGIYYTPNRWLVLVITLAVAARMIYGLWRIWHAWHTTGHDSSWLAAAGIPGSMAVGALVIGYYLAYSLGLAWQTKKQ